MSTRPLMHAQVMILLFQVFLGFGAGVAQAAIFNTLVAKNSGAGVPVVVLSPVYFGIGTAVATFIILLPILYKIIIDARAPRSVVSQKNRLVVNPGAFQIS